jgi:hypothetical protein
MIDKYQCKENIEKAKKIRVGKTLFITQPSVFNNFFLEGVGGGWGYRVLLGFIGFQWVFWKTTSALGCRNSLQFGRGFQTTELKSSRLLGMYKGELLFFPIVY